MSRSPSSPAGVKPAATIYDVARQAQVSIKTVSRVFNKEPNVRPVLQERVMKAAQELSYRPSLSARGLGGSKSFLLVVFADAALTLEHWRGDRGNNYLDRVQLGVLVRCRPDGFHLLTELVDLTPDRLEESVTNLLASIRPDGVVLTPPSADSPLVLDVLERFGVPCVRLGATTAPERGGRVFMDDQRAAFEMTEHLIGLGHRDIGFIAGDPRFAASQMRRKGFAKAMKAHGLEIRPEWIAQGDFTFESGLVCGRQLLGGKTRPSAIFASNDDMALAVLRISAELGLKSPDDISVGGFDNTPSAQLSSPPLTSIRQPVGEMAVEATDMLLQMIRGEPLASTARVLPFTLVRGGSTGPAGAAVAAKPARLRR
jgi:LacI family transcriptional regulator